MSCTQSHAFPPDVKLGAPSRASSRASYSRPSCLNVSAISKVGSFCKAFPRLVCSSSNYGKFDPICLGNGGLRKGNEAFPRLVCGEAKNMRFGPVCFAKGNSKNRENEGFSWESWKNVMGNMGKEESVQDWVKKQMRENEFGGDGGDGGRPGGGGDGSGAEDEGSFASIMDELFQVILATIGFIFVYIYLIRGAELTRLARDCIKYLFGATPSMRLRRAMQKWKRFRDSISMPIDTRKDWLEQAIVATPTWWNNPKKLERFMRSKIDDDDDDDD